MKRFKWALIPLGVIVVLTGLVLVLGATAPREHVASVRVTLPPPQQAVWDAITDVQRYPIWRPGIEAVTHEGVGGGVTLGLGAINQVMPIYQR